MYKVYALIATFAFTSKALADCAPVTPVNVGDVVNCPGYIFSPTKELELRTINEDYKLLKESTDLYIQQKELYKKELNDTQQIADKEAKKAELWRAQAELITEKYTKSEERQGVRDYLFLSLGVGLTVLSAYAIGQIAKRSN